MPRTAPFLSALALSAALGGPLEAQRRADEARLTIGVSLLHLHGGGSLWRVGAQPILGGAAPDTIALSRRLTSGFGVSFTGAFFPSSYYGFSAELAVQRIGTADECQLRSAQSQVYTQDLCGSLQNIELTANTATVIGGVLLRPGFRGSVQPFARAMAGMVVVQQSLVLVEGLVRSPNGIASASVYRDEDLTTSSPHFSIGAGFAGAIAPGWQMRFEVRDTWMRLPAVLGATSRQGVQPEVGRRGHHQLQISLGVDVVLERKRGRRY